MTGAKIADVPEEQFEAALADPDRKPPTAGIIAAATPPKPEVVPTTRNWRQRIVSAPGAVAVMATPFGRHGQEEAVRRAVPTLPKRKAGTRRRRQYHKQPGKTETNERTGAAGRASY
jgi:hypothetical protein